MTLNYKVLLATLGAAYVVYSFYVLTVEHKAPNMENPKAIAGKMLFQKYNCIACHQLYGLGGNLGPDITNSYAKGGDYVKAFLKSGTQTMPNFHLSDSEVNDLVEYLKYTNSTGSADPRTFTLTIYGTASQ